MDSLYGDAHRALQDDFGTTKLAGFLDKHHVHRAIDEQDRAFIESRDLFFLSTVDERGNPTVSYKGGPTGVVSVVDDTTLAFPGYDGNGMFLSMGNIAGQGKVGLLFIDFETPHRLRVQGTARIVKDDPLKARYPEAQYIVRVAVETLWVNCRATSTATRGASRAATCRRTAVRRPSPSGSASTSCSRSSRTRTGRGSPPRVNSISAPTAISSRAGKPRRPCAPR